jgi:hypothetical protein
LYLISISHFPCSENANQNSWPINSFRGTRSTQQVVMTSLEIDSSFTWYTLHHNQSYHSNTVTSWRVFIHSFFGEIRRLFK